MANENNGQITEYETVNSNKTCKSFEDAVREGLSLLAEKDGFKLDHKEIVLLEGEAPKVNYKVTVKFDSSNTLIIKQKSLGSQEGRYKWASNLSLDFEWPQASDLAKQMVRRTKERFPFKTKTSFELIPDFFKELLEFKTKTYFSDSIYSTLFTILKIYDLDYLEMNNKVESLLQEKAKEIQIKYQNWLSTINKQDKKAFSKDRKSLLYLTDIIESLDQNTQGGINFIDHLIIDTSTSQPSIKCSQQLTLTFNMLKADLLVSSLFNMLSDDEYHHQYLNFSTSWDALMINGLNMLVAIDPFINKAIINLLIQNPKEGRKIINTLQDFGKESTHFPENQDDYPLYDSMIKHYYINDGTNTLPR